MRAEIRSVMSNSHAGLTPAAQYLRVSTAAQNQSLGGQAATISAYAEHQGYEVVASYEDAGRSGVTAKGRVGLGRLMSDVLGGQAAFTTILVLDVSRWGRYQDPDEAAHYEFLCRSAGIQIRYCSEAFEEGPTASIMKQLKRVMAGEYSRELSAKIVRSKRRGESLGHTQGGPSPYGIQRREVHRDGSPGAILPRAQRKGRPEYAVEFIPGPEHEQRLVRQIFKMYVKDGLNPTGIATRLNVAGEVWHDGTPWSVDRISLILRDELLIGRQVRGRNEQRLGLPRVYVPKAQWRVTHRFKAVVPPALFKAAQERRAELKKGTRTEEEMLDDLRRLWREHGSLSSEIIAEDRSVACLASYVRRFGSLTAAYACVGYVRPWARTGGTRADKAEVLGCLRRLARKHQGRVTMQLIIADLSLPSRYSIKVLFGSVRAACEEASVVFAPHGGRMPSSGATSGSQANTTS